MNATTSCKAMHSAPHRPETTPSSPGRPAARPERKPDAASAMALKNILFFFSLVFRYPDETIYPELERHLETFGDVFCGYAGNAPKLPPKDELQPDYVALFVNNQGFVPAVPYASCHLDNGLVMGPTYDAVKQIMGQTGFALPDSAKELEDHLAVLLEFAASLVYSLGLTAENPGSGDPAVLIDALCTITFEVIEPMIDRFAAGVADYAASDFYRTAATALAAFIHDAGAVYEEVLGLSIVSDETSTQG